MKVEFLNRMEEMLKEEYPAYVETLQQERFRGLRVNTLRECCSTFQEKFPYPLTPTAFCKETFYIDSNLQHLGKHPLHAAGVFYLQEPSASSVVEVLDVQQGEWILDVCAAPGGKSGQIAAKLAHSGCLVSNEIDHKRAQILLSNMERLGVGENIITNAHPKDLCSQLSGCFDKVLVDAPCSGEGMFKKHTAAMDGWSQEHVYACGQRQLQILHSAYEALKENGILVYSTCTYAMEENEHVVAQMLRDFPDLQVCDCNVTFGREGIKCEGMDATKVRRIFPMDKGEGHFIAKFKKCSPEVVHTLKTMKPMHVPDFVKETLDSILDLNDWYITIVKDKVYIKATPFVEMKGCNILRQGILCGEIIKHRLEPHQHLFVSAQVRHRLRQIYEMDDIETKLFMSGNQLFVNGYKGYVALCYQGHIVGFGKGDGNVIKNKYPKGLRINI